MDPLTIIGAISGILTIAQGLIKLTRKLNQYRKTAKQASKHIKYFLDEIILFKNLMKLFYKAASTAVRDFSEEQQREHENVMIRIYRQVSFVFDETREFVERYVRIHKDSTTKWQIGLAQFLWSMKKPDIKELQMCMNTSKANGSFMMSYFMLQIEKNKGDNTHMMYVDLE